MFSKLLPSPSFFTRFQPRYSPPVKMMPTKVRSKSQVFSKTIRQNWIQTKTIGAPRYFSTSIFPSIPVVPETPFPELSSPVGSKQPVVDPLPSAVPEPALRHLSTFSQLCTLVGMGIGGVLGVNLYMTHPDISGALFGCIISYLAFKCALEFTPEHRMWSLFELRYLTLEKMKQCQLILSNSLTLDQTSKFPATKRLKELDSSISRLEVSRSQILNRGTLYHYSSLAKSVSPSFQSSFPCPELEKEMDRVHCMISEQIKSLQPEVEKELEESQKSVVDRIRILMS